MPKLTKGVDMWRFSIVFEPFRMHSYAGSRTVMANSFAFRDS